MFIIMFLSIYSVVIFASEEVEINEKEKLNKISSTFLTGPVRRLAASDRLFAYVGFEQIFEYKGNKSVNKIEFSSGWSPGYGIMLCNTTNKLYVRGQPSITEIDLINGTYKEMHASPPHSHDGTFAVSYDGLTFYDGEGGLGGSITSYDLSPSGWGNSTYHNLNLRELSTLAVTPNGSYLICEGISDDKLGVGGKPALFILNPSNLTEMGRIFHPGSYSYKIAVTGNSRFAVTISDGQICVFNLKNRTYQGNITIKTGVRDIATTKDKVYVTGGKTIYEIDPNSTKILRNLSINGTPSDIAISSDEKTIYTIDGGRNKIIALNIKSGKVLYEIDEFGPIGWDVFVTHDSKYAVMPNVGISGPDVGFFGVVDLEFGTAQAISMPIPTNDIVLKPNSYEVAFYKADMETSNLYFFDLKTENLTGPFFINGSLCGDLTYGPNGRFLYLVKSFHDSYHWSRKYTVIIYDTINKSSSEISISGAPSCIRTNRNLTKLYVGYRIDFHGITMKGDAIGGIDVIKLSNNSLLKTTKFYTSQEHGDSCYSMEIDTEREIAFVEFWGEGTKIVNLTSNQTIKTLTPRSGRPFAFNSNKSVLWMGSYGTGASYWNPPLLKVQTSNFSVVQLIDLHGYRTLGLCTYKDGLVVTTFGETIIINLSGSSQQSPITITPIETVDENDTPENDINISQSDPDEKKDNVTEDVDNKTNNDIDGDNYKNDIDKFPNDPKEWSDTDSDGIGDNSDPDIDNDEFINEEDKFPYDPLEWADDDNDGLGDNVNDKYLNDRDNDDHIDSKDHYPDDPTRWEKESSKSDDDYLLTYILISLFIVIIILISLYIIKKRK